MSFVFWRQNDPHPGDLPPLGGGGDAHRLREAMEVCRPGSSDVDEPDFAFLASQLANDSDQAEQYDRIQAVDARIQSAIRDVPVGLDLADRILMRLGDERPTRRLSRRQWIVGGALTTAAGMLAAVWLESRKPRPMPEQYVLCEGIRFFANSHVDFVQGAPPSAYPFSNMLPQRSNPRWGLIADFLGCTGAAYELSGPVESRGVLYVAAGLLESVRTAPAWQPFSTADCSASAWQERGLLYVLVVQGGPATYQQYIYQPTQPIA